MLRTYVRFPLVLTLLITVFLLAAVSAYAVWNGTPYAPGETLDPACGPEDPSCIVALPPTFATTTLNLPDIFTVTGTLALAGIDPAHVTLASQSPNEFLAAPLNREGEPTFRLIAQQDLPNPIWKDVVGTVYGNFVGGTITATSATSTHLYASIGHFDTLTVGGRVVGADEFTASDLCGLSEQAPVIPKDELDFPPEPAILSNQEEESAAAPDSSTATITDSPDTELPVEEPPVPIPDVNEILEHELSP
jgi:hypothetical protein